MSSPETLLAGRYDLRRPLGEGGMGVVFAAHDTQLDRPVAIKMLRPQRSDARARERVWREARAAARVTHPNICQIYEVGDAGEGRTYIAMELLEGESLAACLPRGPLAAGEAIPIALAVLAALEALHGRDLVHRDLKPSNIFLTPHGVKVLDFGLARSIVGTDEQTATATTLGVVMGSPAYMAPEQVRGEPIDGRADLFALGVVLFEMLVGKPPFTGSSTVDLIHAVAYERPPALGGSASVGGLDRVIRKALEKKPVDRYQSAGEMAQALRVVLAQLESGEQPRVHQMTRLIVVPFRLLRPDPDTDFLAFSLADAIATTLSGLGSLIVRSSMTGAQYAGAALDVKTIAREAEVDVVLTGTLLRAGDQIRLAAQLLAVPEATILCSHTMQVPLGDLFQLQDHLVRSVVEALALPLAGRDAPVDRDAPASARAYELYLRANSCFYDSQRWPVARDLYLQCVAEDPAYAPAWARLGRCCRLTAKFAATSEEEMQRHLALAQSAFERALALNPELPLAHNLLTGLETDLGRAADAVVRLVGRVRQRPADPDLFAGLVHACRYCGLLEASVAAHERARHLDPQIVTTVAHTYWMLGEYERALEDPSSGAGTGYVRGLALASLGRTEEAVAYLRAREAAATSRMIARYLFALRALLEGDPTACRDALGEVAAPNPDPESVFYVARTYARLGETDRAIAELARAVDHGFFCAPVLVADSWLDPLRGDGRFPPLLRRAQARHWDAVARFVEAGGERLLGLAGMPGRGPGAGPR